MDRPVASAPSTIAEPRWPDGPGPYLFVIEVSGPLERQLLEQWIRRNRPEHLDPGSVQVAVLPSSRRSPRRKGPASALPAFLDADEDALVIPMRLVWMAPERNGRRSARLSDIVKLGDPRDPGPIRQYLTHRLHPDRARIIVGDAARTSALREEWLASDALREGRSFSETVVRLAWGTLESAERELRGTRYKVPKFPRAMLTDSARFRAGVARLAREENVSFGRMSLRTARYVREIAATHSPYVIDIVTGGFRWLIGKAYVRIEYDPEELAALYQLGQRYPLVFLPTHKSHFDHQSLQFALYENGLPPNHTAGGIDMNFFPVGPLVRRSGVFFIRREFKENEPYKFVLRSYVDYLLQHRFPLEWYIEGTRSRIGKLLPPRFGMLAYVVESYLRGAADDVVFIPVAIAYDQIQDVASYAAEQAGGPKTTHTFRWLIRSIRKLDYRYGSIHIRLAAPISLSNFLADLGETPEDADDLRSPAIPKLAFDIANRINEVTPITPISLVTLVLLAADDQQLTVAGLEQALAPYLDEVAARHLPVTESELLADRTAIERALQELTVHDIVRRRSSPDGGAAFHIAAGALLAAAYYRNTVVHHFLRKSVAEIALAAVTATGGTDRQDYIDAAREIRELLIFEFFFSGREEHDQEMRDEAARHDPDWSAHTRAGETDQVLAAFAPFSAPAVVGPFLETYRILGDEIEEQAYLVSLDEAKLIDGAMERGHRYVADGTIRSGESVSKTLLQNGIRLARRSGVFDETPDMVERRKAFAATIRRHVDLVSALASHGGP